MFQDSMQEIDCRAAIESLPHLAAKMCSLWKTRELDTFIHTVLMDSRDGKRQGLPVEVAQEMIFIAKLNLLVRATEAAPRLQLSIKEAADIIVAGDRSALGLPADSDDPWSLHGIPPDKPERPQAISPIPAGTAASQQPPPEAPSPSMQAQASSRRDTILTDSEQPGNGAKGNTNHYMSLFLNPTPPIPSLVRIDLTSQAAGPGAVAPAEAMSWEFYRCIAREIRSLGVDELALSHLGCTACPWLAEAIRFAKQQCHFPQVSLQVDALTASDRQLDEALAAGLDSLVLHFDMSSPDWRARADDKASQDPNFFPARMAHLLQKREEVHSRTLHRCQVKVYQAGKTLPGHKLTPIIAKLAELADAANVEWLPDTPDASAGESAKPAAEAAGNSLCWIPFIEANVRANGHLVVCAHDCAGASSVADLKQTEFPLAWHAQAFQQTRRGLLEGRTRGTLCSACPRLNP